jgi:hypothetical protein
MFSYLSQIPKETRDGQSTFALQKLISATSRSADEEEPREKERRKG